MTRRPMRRLSDLLPDLATHLGIQPELRAANQALTWERLVTDLVPHASGTCHVLDVRPPTLVVSVPDAATAQELRLHASVLLDGFAILPDGQRLADLKVVVRPR